MSQVLPLLIVLVVLVVVIQAILLWPRLKAEGLRLRLHADAVGRTASAPGGASGASTISCLRRASQPLSVSARLCG